MLKETNQSFEKISTRLKKMLECTKDLELATALEMSQQNFSSAKKRNRVPNDNIVKLALERGFDLNYIYTGKINPREQARIGNIEIESDDLYLLYYADIYASAGLGTTNGDSSSETLNIDRRLLQNCASSSTEIITVHGDSMSPLINDSDKIFVDRNQRDLINKKIYVLRIGDEVFTKKILKTDNPDLLMLVSINPDRNLYPIKTVATSSIEIIGQVIFNLEKL